MSTEKVLRHKAICDELNKLYEKKRTMTMATAFIRPLWKKGWP